jgi:hypothetical protein
MDMKPDGHETIIHHLSSFFIIAQPSSPVPGPFIPHRIPYTHQSIATRAAPSVIHYAQLSQHLIHYAAALTHAPVSMTVHTHSLGPDHQESRAGLGQDLRFQLTQVAQLLGFSIVLPLLSLLSFALSSSLHCSSLLSIALHA